MSTHYSIIYDGTYACCVLLSSLSFASFDVSDDPFKYLRALISDALNVSVRSEQLYASNHDALFFFASADNTSIDEMNVALSYDVDAHYNITDGSEVPQITKHIEFSVLSSLSLHVLLVINNYESQKAMIQDLMN